MNTFKKTSVALGLAAAAWAAQAGTMALTPASNPGMNVGDVLNLAVVGQSFAESITGGGFNLSFDPAMLRLDSVSIDAGWEFLPSGGLIDNASGTLSDASFNTFGVAKSGNFNIGTLAFTVIGTGSSMVLPGASATFVWSDSLGNLVVPEFAGASVTAVPEPGTYALMALGLAAVGFMRRRRAD
jgi:hypothetical protein